MSRGPDAGLLLRRVLERHAERDGVELTVSAWRCERWASATFIGAQHRVTLSAAPGAALDAWIAALADADLPLRGHLVADLAILAVVRSDERVELTVEALTVEA